VGEGVPPHHRLVGLRPEAGEGGQQLAGPHQLVGVHPGLEAEVVLSYSQGHHQLLERGVAGALADAVDRHLHLAGPGPHREERVGHGQAEVVVAMDAQHRTGHVAAEPLDEPAVLLGQGVADGVGDVDHRSARLVHALHHLAQERVVAAGGILRGELHVGAESPRLAHALHRLAQRLRAPDLQLVTQVDIGGGQEDVQARTHGADEGAGRGLDVLALGSAQRGHPAAAHLAGDGVHRLPFAVGGHREARLQHVDPQPLELAGQPQLLRPVHAAARRLLAVAQRRVEDLDPGRHPSNPPSHAPLPARTRGAAPPACP